MVNGVFLCFSPLIHHGSSQLDRDLPQT